MCSRAVVHHTVGRFHTGVQPGPRPLEAGRQSPSRSTRPSRMAPSSYCRRNRANPCLNASASPWSKKRGYRLCASRMRRACLMGHQYCSVRAATSRVYAATPVPGIASATASTNSNEPKTSRSASANNPGLEGASKGDPGRSKNCHMALDPTRASQFKLDE